MNEKKLTRRMENLLALNCDQRQQQNEDDDLHFRNW